MAKLIALKSPVGVQGTKNALNYARDHTVENSLNYVVWFFESVDIEEMVSGHLEYVPIIHR